MSIVQLEINGRDYHLDCSEEQRPRLERLARLVEERARNLAESGAALEATGEDQERRFLLLTALLLADRLVEAEARASEFEALVRLGPKAAAAAAPAPGAGQSLSDLPPALAEAMAELLDSASERMDALSTRLERV